MRAVQSGTLPDTCLIERSAGSQTDVGEGVETWSTLAAAVPCRLAPNTERERDYGARSIAVGEWVLSVAYDQDLEAGDRVTVDSRVFRVVGIDEDRSWSLVLRAALVEVRTE
jgi:head-tail adaptor